MRILLRGAEKVIGKASQRFVFAHAEDCDCLFILREAWVIPLPAGLLSRAAEKVARHGGLLIAEDGAATILLIASDRIWKGDPLLEEAVYGATVIAVAPTAPDCQEWEFFAQSKEGQMRYARYLHSETADGYCWPQWVHGHYPWPFTRNFRC